MGSLLSVRRFDALLQLRPQRWRKLAHAVLARLVDSRRMRVDKTTRHRIGKEVEALRTQNAHLRALQAATEAKPVDLG